jgi:predicted ATPase
MFLEIHNIGKIGDARIEMRGMTVIAGNNNSGKSTFGKILYCMFNAFCNTKVAIQNERKDNIENTLDINPFLGFHSEKDTQKLVDNIIKHISSKEEIREIVQDAINKRLIDFDEPESIPMDTLVERIMRSAKVSDAVIQKNILTRFLRAEFENQITHVNRPDEIGKITLNIKNKKIEALNEAPRPEGRGI